MGMGLPSVIPWANDYEPMTLTPLKSLIRGVGETTWGGITGTAVSGRLNFKT